MKKINEVKNSKKFNATINLVHEEMESVKKNIRDWKVRMNEKFYNVFCYDLQFLSEDDLYLLQSKYDGIYDLSEGYDDNKRSGAALHRVTLEDYSGEEYTCEFRTVKWDIYNRKMLRKFTFSNEGEIAYSQTKTNRTEEDQSFDYMARYNVQDNNLYLNLNNIEDKLSIVLNGGNRGIYVNGILLSEDGNTIEIEECKRGTDSYIVNVNELGKVESRIYRDDDKTYVFSNGELILATKRVGKENIELPIEKIDLDTLRKRLSIYTFSSISDEEVSEKVSALKDKLINAVKSIKGDALADGLAKRLDILLSMINAKNIQVEEEKIKRKTK